MLPQKENRVSILSVLALALGLAAASWAIQSGSDVLAKLGLTPASAKEGSLETLMSGSAYNEAAFKAFKALPPSGRAVVVKSGLAWIKAYAESAEFKSAYAKAREAEGQGENG